MSQIPPDPPGDAWGSPQAPLGAPAPGRGGMSGAVKVLIAAAVVAIVAIGGFVLLGGDDGGDDDPAVAVRDYFDAAQARDCERMISLVSEASWSQDGEASREEALSACADRMQDDEFLPAGTTITATEVANEEGDTAQVEVTTSSQDLGEQTETIPMVREDGRWVVDFAGPGEDG